MSQGDFQGGCLCKSIRYRIRGAPVARALCHCRSCRLAAGAPSVAWISVAHSDFEVLAGEPVRFRSSPAVIRTFCGKCGTSLTYQHDEDRDTIDVTTATLDLPEAFPPTREVWVEQRIPWVALDENRQHLRRGSTEGPGSAA